MDQTDVVIDGLTADPLLARHEFVEQRVLIDHLRTTRGEVDAREAVAYLLRINLAAEPQPQRIDSLAEFVESRGGRLDNTMLIALMCLITAMPEYQLC